MGAAPSAFMTKRSGLYGVSLSLTNAICFLESCKGSGARSASAAEPHSHVARGRRSPFRARRRPAVRAPASRRRSPRMGQATGSRRGRVPTGRRRPRRSRPPSRQTLQKSQRLCGSCHACACGERIANTSASSERARVAKAIVCSTSPPKARPAANAASVAPPTSTPIAASPSHVDRSKSCVPRRGGEVIVRSSAGSSRAPAPGARR